MKGRMKYFWAYFWSVNQGISTKLGFQSIMNSCKVPILNYHSVAPSPNRSGFRVMPDSFEDQISYLTSHYNVISLSMFIDQLCRNRLIKNAAVVTFDDGYKDNYIYAYPILRKYKCHATIFIPTGFIEREVELVENEKLEPLSWSEIIEMKASKLISFGSHGHSHNTLTKISLKEINMEIELSKKILEDKLKQEVNLFAYPNGQWVDFNSKIISILKSKGFAAACSTIWSIKNSPKKLFFLNRILIPFGLWGTIIRRGKRLLNILRGVRSL